VTVSDGTVYERVAIRNYLAAKREDGEAPRGPTTNQPLLPMRHEQGMVELAKPEFTSELEFRDPEFEKSSNKVRSI